MKAVLTHVANWVIKTGLLLLFNYIGWLKLHPAVEQHTWKDTVLVAGVVGLLVVLIAGILVIVLELGGVFTCLLSLLALPLVGFFTLRIIAATAPQFLTLHHNKWVVVLMGLALGWITVPAHKKDEPESSISVSASV